MSKIYILDQGEVQARLGSFIEAKNIPKCYGGGHEWTWGERPSLDPAIRERVAWEGGLTDFPPGPLYWRNIEGNRVECISVGSVNQVERHNRVGTMERAYHGELAIVQDTSSAAADGPVPDQKPAPTEAAEGIVSAKPQPAPEAVSVSAEVQGVQKLSLGGDNSTADVSEKIAAPDAPANAPAQTTIA